jgi:hypothetical protein
MIKPSGNRIKDAMLANAAADYKITPGEGAYIWHHHEQTGRMQLLNE